MKIVTLGDIHGRSIWKDILNKENDADKFIFAGDYFDTRNGGYSANRQITNFKDILEFKKANMDKVILLTGNHDYHYIKGIYETYSGYQHNYAIDIGEVIQTALNEDILQMCYTHDNYVFTHAGVTKTWAEANEIDLNNLQQSINDLFKSKPHAFGFTSGDSNSRTGDDVTQTPIWVRPQSLDNDIIDGVVCVVGHTTVSELTITERIILIDSLGTSKQYLSIIDGIPTKTLISNTFSND